ncbi:hypothetical protein TrLO_g9559 [Triparma laevis f. longispina]|uniref:EF-hand domain-containing protein n=1 Tax=Triparma laevis f. longispina TaxID=1714387 RepID=A0A9W6ZE11_9STRA|nr:hypothetical protein TrLO_g9559 [Triparma laevis f. longispina]
MVNFPSLDGKVSSNTVRRDPADAIPSSGGAGRKASLRKSMLSIVLNQKSEASTSPTQLQKKYNQQNSPKIPQPTGQEESKFVKWDDFPGVWRCDPPSDKTVNCSLDFAMKVANSMSQSSINQEELDNLMIRKNPQTRQQLYHSFLSAFPDLKVTPLELSSVCKHFRAKGYDKIVGKEIVVSLLRFASQYSLDEEFDDQEGKRSFRRTSPSKIIKGAKAAMLEDQLRKKAQGVSDVIGLKKMKVMMDKEEMHRNAAMKKIEKAAAAFSGKAGLLKGFKESDMTKQEFSDQLKRAFGVNLGVEELEAVSEIFDLDGDGMISCQEFMSLFFRIKRTDEAQRKRQSMVKKEQMMVEKIKREKKAAKKYQKEVEACTEDWTEDDLKSAVELIAEVAAGWDLSKAGFGGLKGFQCAGLDAMQLREQLWRTFDLSLTKAELGALVETFDADGDGSVDGPEFLSMFFRLQKREQAFLKQQEKARLTKEKALKQQKMLEQVKEEEAKMAKLVSTDFTEEDLNDALSKITNASRSISKRQGTGPSPLAAFTNGPPMQPAVLRSNLARFLKVFLTPKQVGALVSHFDSDGDGTVNGGEFLKQCNALWQKVDSEAVRHMMEHRKKHVEKREKYNRLHEEKIIKELTSVQLCEYGREDALSAMKKLRKAALMFDDRVNISLKSFQGAPMNPYEFKDLLNRVLKVKLSIRELSSLVGHFDSDGDSTVSGSEFLSAFFALRRSEQLKVVKKNLEISAKKEEHLKELKTKHMIHQEDAGDEMLCDYSVNDLRKAVEKVKHAAESFNPRMQSLGGFTSGGAMGPREFKAELKKALGVKLTNQQLTALFFDWDKDEKGLIDSAEFLSKFYRFRDEIA